MSNKNIRVLVVPVYILFDPSEVEDEDGKTPVVTKEDAIAYLEKAMTIDYNNEEHGDPIGVLSLNVHINDAVELSPDLAAKVIKTYDQGNETPA